MQRVEIDAIGHAGGGAVDEDAERPVVKMHDVTIERGDSPEHDRHIERQQQVVRTDGGQSIGDRAARHAVGRGVEQEREDGAVEAYCS